MRQNADFFGDRELPLVYVARKLKDALRIEEVLTQAGIDYAVESDRYWTGRLIRRERIGAFFYVAPEIEAAAREALDRAGFRHNWEADAPADRPSET
jgi:hypothetical protein